MDDLHINLDESVRKLAVLPGGQAALITGKGVRVAGSLREIDVTDLPQSDRDHLRDNLSDIQVNQKGDRITLKPRRGRAITVQAKGQNDA